VNSVVDKLLLIFNALDHDSKLLFLAKAVVTPDRTGGSPEADPTFGVGGGRWMRSDVWMRRVDAYDGEGRGVLALKGDWLKKDDVEWLGEGTIVLIGIKKNVEGPYKMYMIAKRIEGSEVKVSNGTTLSGLDPCTGWLHEWRDVVRDIQKFV